jgi:hypothetical protein
MRAASVNLEDPAWRDYAHERATVVNALMEHHRDVLSPEDVRVLTLWEERFFSPSSQSDLADVRACFTRTYASIAAREDALRGS